MHPHTRDRHPNETASEADAEIRSAMRTMRRLLRPFLVPVLLGLTACGSAPADTSTGRTMLGGRRSTNSQTGTKRLTVRLVATNGPTGPAGPIAATSLPALEHEARAGHHGRRVACHPGPCWAGTIPPAKSLLIAFRPTLTACYAIRSIGAALVHASVQVDARMAQACHGGGGQAALARSSLIAIPLSELSPRRSLKIVLRVAAPGTPLAVVGRTRVTL